MGNPGYRADIDGLRAIAVLLVVLGHLGIGPAGGFVGVDVFFVISGYLITGIVRGELRNGTFSFRRFYARRARRILPALVIVCLASLAAGWFLLLPPDFEALGTQVVTALLGVSNIYFALKTGYFDQSASLLPLLHTWSLGVEEQFYLVWPLALLLLHRWLRLPRTAAAWLGCGALLAMLAVAQVIVENYPDVSFYVPFTRAWELGLGAALTYLPQVRGRGLTEGAPIVGLAMIAAAVLLYSDETSFPGVTALLPCLGAALVVLPAAHDSVAGRLLALPPLVWIGRISYSPYLWHWPFLVFTRHYFHGGAIPEPVGFAILLAAIVTAALSWTFVEQPFRTRRFGWRSLAAATTVVLVAGVGALATSGIPGRLSERGQYIASFIGSSQAMPSNLCNLNLPDPCAGSSQGREAVFLFGDSHARHFMRGFAEIFPTEYLNLATNSGCRPVLRPEGASACIRNVQAVYRDIIPGARFKAIILSARWRNGESDQIAESVEYLKRFADRVIVFGQTVEYSAALPNLLLSDELLRAPVDLSGEPPRTPALRTLNETIEEAARAAGAEYYDPLDAICSNGTCRQLAPDGAPMQRDYGHLTQQGAAYVLERFKADGLTF